jgi:hypothetical protein
MKTFRGFVKDLQKIYENHKQLNDFGFGYIEDVTIKHVKEGAVQYPYLFVIPSDTSVDEREITYSMTLIVMDRQVQGTDENLLEVLSDTNQILQDVIAQFKYSNTNLDGDYSEVYDIQLPVTLQPFSDRFDDYVSGYFATITIILGQGLDRCIAPFDNF